jgi:sugar lactone lactonase YvrE
MFEIRACGVGVLWLGYVALATLLWSAPAAASLVFDDGFEQGCGRITLTETFASNGPQWPQLWVNTGGVDIADVQNGQGRLRPQASNYTVARMWAPVSTRDVEARFRFVMEDQATQGLALLLRHNGGYLTQTNPVGQGYGVFIEGAFLGQPGISLWREVAGVEQRMAHSPASVPGPVDQQAYRVRVRINQVNATTTLLQAKYWPEGNPEPIEWHVTVNDTTPALQQTTGGVGVDSASGINAPAQVTASVLVDDIEIEPLCNPVFGQAASLVSQSFQFTEGPLWRGDHLLFSDITGNTIYRLDPPAMVTVFRAPSDQANGLALDGQGRLLAGEAATRRISITDGNGVRSTLVDRYQGARFNSPNDMAVRSDGVIYFTDPDFGLTNPPMQRELPHNSVYRLTPGGALTLEWQGTVGMNEPNGVQLSQDETRLFITDTQAGTLRRFDVAADGALSNNQVLATGLSVADGTCLDTQGNIYVGVAAGLEVFAPDGARFGLIPIPRMTANCAFGDADLQSIYVTARQGLYRVRRP